MSFKSCCFFLLELKQGQPCQPLHGRGCIDSPWACTRKLGALSNLRAPNSCVQDRSRWMRSRTYDEPTTETFSKGQLIGARIKTLSKNHQEAEDTTEFELCLRASRVIAIFETCVKSAMLSLYGYHFTRTRRRITLCRSGQRLARCHNFYTTKICRQVRTDFAERMHV